MIPLEELTLAIEQDEQANWTPRESPILDLSDRQRKTLLGVEVDMEDVQSVMAGVPEREAEAREAGAPTAIDWRNVGGRNYVTSVKNQGNCGSCVSFCCCASLESKALIQANRSLDLSEADLHFCSSHGANCGGWWPTTALDQLRTRGTPDEACFPYSTAFSSSGPTCIIGPNRDARAVKITGFSTLTTMSERKEWLANKGPVCAVYHVYDDFFGYGSGVYRHVSGASAGYHCVEVIGYSDTEGCWICKNSWGATWGDSGYFKIAYGECGIDNTSNDTDGGNVNRFQMWGINEAVFPQVPARWQGWESLGGIITAGVGVSSWAANRLDCFVKGSDNRMWHKWWAGGWSGWENLGGTIDGAPAAVSWGPNRIDCFVRGMNNHMFHKWWNGFAWSGWEDLGGIITAGPSVSSWAANRLDCFVKGSDNHMWHKWWNGSSWSGWEDLGGVIDGEPAAVSWGPNRIDCFVRGMNNHMFHKWWNGSSWSGWEDLGGIITAGPSVSSWAANRLDCFVKGSDNQMWHKWWNGSSWQGWEGLGGTIDDNVGSVSWDKNRIDCFARGMNNHMFHKWWG